MICDEAQAVKNPESNRRQALATIPRRYAIPMTGTPVENTLLDLWSLVDLAVPGMLGERSVFEVEYPDTLEAGQGLAQLTDPVILKRRVVDVAGDLPERIDVDLPVLLDDDLARQYELVRQSTLEKYPVAGALVATLQLQLFCAHIEGEWTSRSRDQLPAERNGYLKALSNFSEAVGDIPTERDRKRSIKNTKRCGRTSSWTWVIAATGCPTQHHRLRRSIS